MHAQAELPLDVRLSKALLVSGELECSEEMLTIAATLSVQSIWCVPYRRRIEEEIALNICNQAYYCA